MPAHEPSISVRPATEEEKLLAAALVRAQQEGNAVCPCGHNEPSACLAIGRFYCPRCFKEYTV